MDTRVNIGRTVARERRRRGVTQEELAAHLGVSKAAVSKWELGQSLPDVSLLPRIAAYFSLTLDELFDWHDELSEEDAAALYAEVYALGGRDPAAAHERLRTLAAEHYSDANLLLMLASLLTVWAAGMATPFAPASAGAASAGAAPAAAADDAPADLPDASIGAAALPDSPALTDEVKALAARLEGGGVLVGWQGGRAVPLAAEDILRCYGEEKGVKCQTPGGVYDLKERLYELEGRLDRHTFVRISHSEIISLRKITALDLSLTGTIRVTLEGGAVSYVSRRYVRKIKEALGL